jgi:UDP-N-acetylglucosamine 2-epimerase (non-hydrolysing)
MKKVITVIGTRPEAIKLIPIIILLQNSKYFQHEVCTSSQHTDLVESLLINNNIKMDYNLESSPNNSSVHERMAHMLLSFSLVFKKAKPDIVIVQGDTTTAFSAALAAFYLKIPVAHIEAGLRTYDVASPWPEEMHRCLIDKIATYFFAPTNTAKEALISEGIDPEKIWVVGNTSIDAIRLAQKHLRYNKNTKEKIIVATVHRKENYGEPLIEICQGLASVAQKFPQIKILFCVHPNPAVYIPVTKMLSCIDNIDIVEPMEHHRFIELMYQSTFIITDSGGIQEEASFMGKPVIVARNTTERSEGLQAGTAKLIGTKAADIVSCCTELLVDQTALNKMSRVHFSYGDGFAAERIIKILEKNVILSEGNL